MQMTTIMHKHEFEREAMSYGVYGRMDVCSVASYKSVSVRRLFCDFCLSVLVDMVRPNGRVEMSRPYDREFVLGV